MLPDLPKIIDELKSNAQYYEPTERSLSEAFKEAYNASAPDDVEFQWETNTAFFKSPQKKLGIVCPYQWFYYAVYAIPLYNALSIYRKYLMKIFSTVTKKEPYFKKVRDDKALSANDLALVKKEFANSPKDAEAFEQWLTNYPSWCGQKSVGRTDFFVSSILTAYGLSNDYQSYIAELTKQLSKNTRATEILLQESKQPNAAKQIQGKEIPFGDNHPSSGGKNTIFYGAPGTGKSYTANSKAKRNPIIRTVFHSDTSYQDFVGSYRPCKVTDKFSYEFTPGPFVSAITLAQNNPHEMFTLLIEEINRANAGAVFGEMFQLLDRDEDGESEYQITPENALAEYLKEHTTYMGESLWIPANLNITATMNSADQGVFPMDSAFKRRWNFEYLPIDFTQAQHSEELLAYAGQHITWKNFASTINKQLASHHVNEDRHLGPFFIKPNEIKGNGNIASKVLIYLWDDVVRHQRRILFKDNYKTFNEVIKAFKNGEDVFSTWDDPITNYLIDKDDLDHAD